MSTGLLCEMYISHPPGANRETRRDKKVNQNSKEIILVSRLDYLQ